MPLKENKLRCRICQRHTYASFKADSSRPAAPTDDTGLRVFGLSGDSESAFKVLRCQFCGHVATFYFVGGKSLPKAWDREAWKRPES